jgi:hypothetical protein
MRPARRRLTAFLATALVIQPALVLTLAACCSPADAEAIAGGAACPMHHAPGEVCPHTGAPHGVPDAAHDDPAAEPGGDEDCRLVCGASRETAAFSQGPSGLLPAPIPVTSPDPLVTVLRIGGRSARELWSPPLAPPPRV